MTTEMSERKSSFTYEELLSCGRGEMFGPGNAQLPLPPMLMFDRITAVSERLAASQWQGFYQWPNSISEA